MGIKNPGKQEMKEILLNAKTIAVVGLSDNPSRTSYQVSKSMQEAGYNIIPVNPTIEESLGVKAVDSLDQIEEPIDIVNVFRRSEYLPEIAKEAFEVDPKAFWAQLGVEHEDAYEYLTQRGVTTIMDTCIKVVHSATLGV
ncbi:CoA-binding protein [Pontibacillus sp. HMF3514]|uniref:CoA-binding protein n=1 Tax=Pontibacillus sp. HMF3514 TaxID=2692425 RepID=UPI00131FCB81|nr:CoA-binding protein [Pontibacillus sp. HMF3514]QHE52326.1 CoA-binding protein [Pontibacillus sp. HMF3514]